MGLFFREIAAFARIVCDVEEIFVVGDLQVFPTTPPYRALVAVTHAPIERAFEFRRPAGQYRQQIDPVERVAVGRSNPGHRETGCGQVHRDGHLVGYASVDAPFQARENVGVVVARGRMLSCVRPVIRQEDSRRPVWEFADRVEITHSVLEAQWKALVVPAPSRRLLRHTLLPLALTSSQSCSAYAAAIGVL